MSRSDIRERLQLRPVINVAGTMTYLGSSIVVPEAIEAMNQILPEFVEMADLQRHASKVISRLTGSEAGFITTSCASGISMAVAGCMTGDDLLAIEKLPHYRGGKNEVIVQAGHLVNFGAPVEQAIRLTGAEVVSIGQATSCAPYQFEGAITERTAAAVYVISHHAVHYGQLPLPLFCEIAHRHGVPVIVDAASEYDLRRFLAEGADIVLYSGHKFLGGPTSGIVAGHKDRVRHAWLQNRGLARGMKVGKENIIGALAALEAWEKRDHQGIRLREKQILQLWENGLAGRVGVSVSQEADPTDNPLDRCKIALNPELARITAWDFAAELAAGSPPIIVRDHLVEHGYLYLDPCNLHPEEEHIVLKRIIEVLDQAANAPTARVTSWQERVASKQKALLQWPD
ncbi:aminotransferase class V-fold PLP-dependent enzyme [Buttiauxella selenatireducens]|uniref:Aminotransferase class V-fold PLP-dependent enzyme n=1 Tax=Buttiauxella selenatireducens TaxID=3073902 RepID=A0ABY9SG14_9ENTR|nr:aminotransferase class V-fold PLP-dependent enzyme [Buttiauxella sp. R73]WMY76091.1 aminotransferase class V-fold PLP-dependent enzyme [Buttiauxella sp. R73]